MTSPAPLPTSPERHNAACIEAATTLSSGHIYSVFGHPLMKLDKISSRQPQGCRQQDAGETRAAGAGHGTGPAVPPPLRYEDRTQVWPIGDLPPGLHGAVEGEIQDTQLVMGRRRMLVCRISDGTGSLTLRFFISPLPRKTGAQGRLIRCFGETRPGKYGLEMAHPEYKLLGEEQASQTEEALTPVYPTTEGAAPAHPAQPHGSGPGPARPLRGRGAAARRPPSPADRSGRRPEAAAPPASVALALLESGQHPAQQRLVLEELLAHNPRS